MTHFFITLACLLPISIIFQMVRSPRLHPQRRSVGADLLEAAGLAVAFSFGLQSSEIIPQSHPWISGFLLFVVIYFPICFLADWVRKRHHDV